METGNKDLALALSVSPKLPKFNGIPRPKTVGAKPDGDVTNANASKMAPQADGEQGLPPKCDPDKQKRIIANRKYAQTYRLKKMEYIAHLERELRLLQAQVAINKPKVEYYTRFNQMLRMENDALREKIEAYNSEIAFKEAQYEELKKEKEILTEYCLIRLKQRTDMLGMNPEAFRQTNMGVNQQPAGYNEQIEEEPEIWNHNEDVSDPGQNISDDPGLAHSYGNSVNDMPDN